MDNLKQKALNYHAKPAPGKLAVIPSKPCCRQADLALAYSPGVAYPCLAIRDNPSAVYQYTGRGNTVGVITNGTAVLGLGNIGALASLPVMEGKALLLKKFADINGLPLAIKGGLTAKKFSELVASLEDNFGAVNLEDIKAPECFAIEAQLQEKMSIPVFHDDQHGTAVITLAALRCSLELTGKKLKEVRIVINGAGAAGLACANLYLVAGILKEQITLLDRRGVIYQGRRSGMNHYKQKFTCRTKRRTLAEALVGADVFIGVSAADVLEAKMVKTMNKQPIIFALANPDPEIKPACANEAGAFIVATGRSDFPNQVNNVLGFPGIFRGALDCRASLINQEMMLAAVEALVELAGESVPADIQKYFADAYPADSRRGLFAPKNPLSPDYIIPKPLDSRVVPRVARRVVQAARDTGVARLPIKNLRHYEQAVRQRIKRGGLVKYSA